MTLFDAAFLLALLALIGVYAILRRADTTARRETAPEPEEPGC